MNFFYCLGITKFTFLLLCYTIQNLLKNIRIKYKIIDQSFLEYSKQYLTFKQ